MNRTAPGSAHTAVGDQRGAAQARGNEETREAAGCAADRAAVVDKCGTAPARLGQHRGAAACVTHRTAVVGDVGMVRGRQVEVCYAAGRAAGRCTVIDNRGTASGRGVEEDRSAALSAGGYGSGVGDDCATSRGRAV